MDSESRFTARGVFEPEPSTLSFLLPIGEFEARSSTFMLLGMFSLLGEPVV